MSTHSFSSLARIFVLALLLPLLAARSRAQNPGQYAVGDVVQDFSLTDRATGKPVDLYSLQGKVIFLEWFAWWCPYCQAAASQLGAPIDQYYANHNNAQGVPVVHVLLNLQGNAETDTQDFLDRYGLSSNLVLNDFDRTVANRFQVGAQPIFAIINGVANSPGHAQWELLYSELGYGQLQFPANTFTDVFNKVQAESVNAAPAVTTQPQSAAPAAGGGVTLTAAVSGSPAPTLQWQRNGLDVAGATNASLMLNNVQPGDTGLYSLVATSPTAAVSSDFAIVGVSTASAAVGDGSVLATDIPHPNGNHYDQVLLTGPAAAIATQGGRVTRTSFIDENNDIVQVEFAGHGTLSLVLDDASGPAPPVNYTQPTVSYMKGHVGLVIAGADETTNVLVFTVGRATAFDPTGHYDILQAAGGTNMPAANGSPLFMGHGMTSYDGVADLAFIAIESTDGKFGGLRASDARFSAVNGLTGVYAPGVAFAGPVFIGDIDAGSVSATEYATPAIIIGSTSDARITGGDLLQTDGQPVEVAGLTQLKFTAGSDSAGNLLPAQTNRAVLDEMGMNVTAQIVVNPSP